MLAARRRLPEVCLLCSFRQLQLSSSQQFAAVRRARVSAPVASVVLPTPSSARPFASGASRRLKKRKGEKRKETEARTFSTSAIANNNSKTGDPTLPEGRQNENDVEGQQEAKDEEIEAVNALMASIAAGFEHARTELQSKGTGKDTVEQPSRTEVDKAEQMFRLDGTRDSLPDVSELAPGEAREVIVKKIRMAWGEELPDNLLTEDEMQLYNALYGAPRKMLNAEEVQKRRMGLPLEGEEIIVDEVLEAEEIYAADPRLPRPPTPTPGEREAAATGSPEQNLQKELTEEEAAELSKHPRSTAENDWIEGEDEQLIEHPEQFPDDAGSKAAAISSILEAVNGILVEQQAATEEEEETISDLRTHPLTLSGRFSTDPSTVSLPRPVIEATLDILHDRNNRHLKAGAEKFGPASVSTDLGKKRQNLPSPLNPSAPHMSGMEAHVFLASVFPQQFAKSMATLTEVRRRLGSDWVRGVNKVLDVGTGGAAVKAWEEIVHAEATAQGWKKEDSKFTAEVQAKAGEEVAKSDSKAQASTPVEASSSTEGLALAETSATAEEESAKADTEAEEPWDWGYGIEGLPNSRGYSATVIAGSDLLQRNISNFLENTLFLPRLPQYNLKVGLDVNPEWEESQRHYAKRSFDLIIASDTILRQGPSHQQKSHVDNLWSLLNPKGGVLVMIEHGSREGFSAIGGARAHLLKRKIKHPKGEGIEHVLTIHEQDRAEELAAEKSDGMIIAPCTNHTDCPMWNTVRSELELKGKMNFCSFNQRFIKPSYLLNLSNRRDQNHQDTQFSYLAVRRGTNEYRPTPENPVPLGVDVNTEWNEFVNFDGPPTRATRRTHQALKDGYSPFEQSEEISAAPKKEYSKAEIRTYMLSTPRAILPPIKAKGHVHIDVCTPEGTLERWTVPRSYSAEAYRDARKASWGDLWALGAKTKTPRAHGLKNSVKSANMLKDQEKVPRRVREQELVEEYEQRNKKHILDMTEGDEIEEPQKLRSKERQAKDMSKNKMRKIMQQNRDNKAKRRGVKYVEDEESRERKFIARKRRQYNAEMKDDSMTYID